LRCVLKKANLLLLTALFFSGSQLQAQPAPIKGQVERVQGNSAIINGGSQPLHMDDEWLTVNSDGKKTGWIKIQQVKNNRAVAIILKGSVTVGESLIRKPEIKKPKPVEVAVPAEDDSEKPEKISRKPRVGVVLGYGIDSISLVAADSVTPTQHSETANLSGGSIKVKGFYDWPVWDSLGFRFLSGIDGFNGNYSAQSTSINKDSSKTSSLSISTLSFDGELMWNFYRTSPAVFWLGGGASIQYALSNTSNLYSLQSASAFSAPIFVGVGANIKMTNTSFLPLFMHFNYFFAGSGFTQTSITLAAGWGWNFN